MLSLRPKDVFLCYHFQDTSQPQTPLELAVNDENYTTPKSKKSASRRKTPQSGRRKKAGKSPDGSTTPKRTNVVQGFLTPINSSPPVCSSPPSVDHVYSVMDLGMFYLSLS